MIRWVVALIGTASPSPTPATAVLTPITLPRPSASAPPELPGLSAASVWITLSITRTPRPAAAGSARPSAETTPAVTEPSNPCGLPIATTSWPTRRRSASPRSAGVSSSPSARTTARSESGSVPATVNAQLAAVGEPRVAAVARADHVGRGEQEAVVGQDDAAAGARLDPAAARAPLHPQAGDRRREPLGDPETARE